MFKFTNSCYSLSSIPTSIKTGMLISNLSNFTSFQSEDTKLNQTRFSHKTRKKHTNLRFQQKSINISFSFRAFGVPWWYIISINNAPVFGWWWLVNQFRSRGDLDRLSWVVKCCHRKSCSIRISNCPMHTALVLPICYNLEPKEFSIRRLHDL